jgi:hypothetical protein
MSTDLFISQKIANNVGAPRSDDEQTRGHIESVMKKAFPRILRGVSIAGSVAKGTNIAGDSDLDLFISFDSQAGVLADVYTAVRDLAASAGWSPREQNVSIGTTILGLTVDLVPGRVQSGHRVWHSLYRRKAKSWVQTNVDEQIRFVRDSGRTQHIRAMKLWRRHHRVPIASFALELAVISACRNLRGGLENTLLECFRTFAQGFDRMRLEDPANTNNNLRDDMTDAECEQVKRAAQRALEASTWSQVLGS